MSAGTITLTNSSVTVLGDGTTFTADLLAGDFVVAVVGGVTYSLPVKTVDSATQLTLIRAYDGPTASGSAFNSVPRYAMNTITAQLAADTANVIRGIVYDKSNWQQVFSGTGTITVTLPDGSTYSGPSWNALSTQLASKADTTALNAYAKKGTNSDITSLSGLTTALSLHQGGTGSQTAAGARSNLGLGTAATLNVGNTSGTVAAGDDGRFGTLEGKTGGTVTSEVVVNGLMHATGFRPTNLSTESSGNARSIGLNWTDAVGSIASTLEYYLVAGQYHSLRMLIDQASFSFRGNGNAVAPGGAWIDGSDRRLKDKFEEIKDATGKVLALTGYTYDMNGQRRAGIVAQDLQAVLPEAVELMGPGRDKDGNNVDDLLGVNYSSVTALLVNAVKEQQQMIEALTARIAALESVKSS
ncbi:tail fiber domain-containing protein [Dickeya fangzhongdai]|uniref:tail fiber domain-containing protein n=1 Tax=Dickeya fangzhongdai TaxID=1778540 RepID=UPI001ADAD6C5|nr:tail fiber domain-containing protein [Dickeya fangzhongdai]MBO8132447.1 tail fiber domain-containing protein [Dickeya fangzhongdai]